MKLTARQVPDFLASPGKTPFTLIYGADEGKNRETRNRLLKSLIRLPADSMSLIHLRQEEIISEPSRLFEALSSLSLIGEAPVTLIEHATDKLTKYLKEALATPPCANALIVTAGELPARSSLRLLFEKDKRATALACYRDDDKEIRRKIAERFRQEKIAYDRSGIDWLVAEFGNDSAVTQSEMEKICLYLGEGGKLTLDDAKLLTGGNTADYFDELCTAFYLKKCESFLAICEKLFLTGENPVVASRALARHGESLMQGVILKSQGISDEALIKKLRIFWKQEKMFLKKISLYDPQKLSSLLGDMLALEMKLKRTSSPSLVFYQQCLSLMTDKTSLQACV